MCIRDRKKYEWEREDYIPENDPFLQQFDENGNFIELPKEPVENSVPSSIKEKVAEENRKVVKIVYSLKKKDKDKSK